MPPQLAIEAGVRPDGVTMIVRTFDRTGAASAKHAVNKRYFLLQSNSSPPEQ